MSAEEDAANLVDELYKFRDNFFSEHGMGKAKDKTAMIKTELEKTLTSLKQHESTCQKTFYFLQCGKALNILPDYSKFCEEYLSKAVKRDPSLIEGWNLLGETFWKKADIVAAKDCFEGSLKREKNKVALRSLSMVLRQLKCTKAEETTRNVIESVELARGAVELDTNDGMSWYILGNAYLSLFFATDQNAKTLSQALTSYTQAEKVDPNSQYNPDLHFNRAQACRYEEDYQSAFKGWQQAVQLDPDWSDPRSRADELLKYLTKVSTLVAQKGKLKAKRLQNLIKSIDDKCLGPFGQGKDTKLECLTLDSLQDGPNAGKVFVGRVVCNFADVTLVPFTFAAVDSEGKCCAVTVYNLAQGKGVIIGDSVAIPEPSLRHIDLALPNETTTQCQFVTIRVDNPLVMVVNGKTLTKDHCAFTKASMNPRNE